MISTKPVNLHNSGMMLYQLSYEAPGSKVVWYSYTGVILGADMVNKSRLSYRYPRDDMLSPMAVTYGIDS